MNKDFYKYLSKFNNWGLSVITCGHYQSEIGTDYPPEGHPSTHTFNWEQGRTLEGCYIIYIPTGKGYLEISSGQKNILPGDVILIYPGEWHRYRPSRETGWEEYWIGFKGPLVNDYLQNSIFPEKKAYVKNIGYHDDVIFLFNNAFEISKKDMPSCSKLLTGITLQIIAYVETPGYQSIPGKKEDYFFEETVSKIRQNIKKGIDFYEIAKSYNMSYSHFRKLFKDKSGLPPNSFLIQERLEYAKRLLCCSDLTIKEVAEKSGFNSVYYFSKKFKEKEGISPGKSR